MPHLLAALVVLLLLITAAPGSAETPAGPLDEDAQTLNLQSRIGDLELVRDGDELLVEHNGHTLTAEQYLALIDTQQQRRDRGGPLFTLFNITTGFGILWVSLGLLGQVLFTLRMVVQWLASEKEHRSVVPPIFWHLSLIGASMLLAYFIWRKDLVGVLGQSTGWAIYARNVFLIRQNKITVRRSTETPANQDAEASPLAQPSDH